MEDTISRRMAIEKFEPWLKVDGYSEGELNMLKAVLYELRFLPSAQPEVTEEAIKEYCRKRCLCIVDSALLKKYASAQPERNMNNKVNLCDSCRKVYPECESTANDIFFGNGVGNDNVCACPHYEPKERKKGKWIKGAEISNRYLEDVYYCSNCHKQAYWDTDYDQQLFDYCPYCGSFNGGQASE